jgi:hypothetical protein
MASEPPTHTTVDPEDPAPLPASAEDRKAAAALSSLDVRGEDEAAPAKEVDADALGQAMKNLSVEEGPKAEAKVVKKVKVDAADVGLLVSFFQKWEEGELMGVG